MSTNNYTQYFAKKCHKRQCEYLYLWFAYLYLYYDISSLHIFYLNRYTLPSNNYTYNTISPYGWKWFPAIENVVDDGK